MHNNLAQGKRICVIKIHVWLHECGSKNIIVTKELDYTFTVSSN